MTVRTQNMDILSAVAGKQTATAGGARAAGDGGTPFVDLMAALGAQSESLVGAAKEAVLLDGQSAGAKAGGSPGAVVDPLQLLSRHRQGAADATSAPTTAKADSTDARARFQSAVVDELLAGRGSADPTLPAEDVAGIELPEEATGGDGESRAAVEQPVAAAASELAGALDLAREIAGHMAGAERAAAAKPADAREPAPRSLDPRLPGATAVLAQRQDAAAAVSADAPVPAELATYLKAGARGAEAAAAGDSNRAVDPSNTFSEALFRAAQGAGENAPATPIAGRDVRPPAAALHADEPFGTQQWGVAMNAQVLTMMKDGVAQARVQINPQNLGPVGIDLSMRNGVVNVSFDSPHTEVREALRDGVKGLERSLSEGGVQLGRVEVRDSLDFMAQGRQQRDAQQDASGGQRQQQEWRQARQGEADFASHLQVVDEDNVGG